MDTCGDGQEALEPCRMERFALILLDLRLPGLDYRLWVEDDERQVLIRSTQRTTAG